MRNLTNRMCLWLTLSLVLTACAGDGGSGGGGSGGRGGLDGGGDGERGGETSDRGDENRAAVRAARDAWPATTGELTRRIDLSGYRVVTIVPFVNLTDNARDHDAGRAFAEQLQACLNQDHADAFTAVRVADGPLGRLDEAVVRGQVYDLRPPRLSPWTGWTESGFKADLLIENGRTGELLKSAPIRKTSHDDLEALIKEAAAALARMLAASKCPA